MKRNTNTQNEMGETTPIMQPLGQVSAYIRPQSAKEILANADNVESTMIPIRIRYTKLIDHADALDFEGRELDIFQIIDIEEEHRELDLICYEVS